MKTVKIVLLVIIAIPLFLVSPVIVGAFGACAFLGFLVLGGLDALGLIKMPTDNINERSIISAVIDGIIFLITI